MRTGGGWCCSVRNLPLCTAENRDRRRTPYIEVCFTGKGRQAELSAELLIYIVPVLSSGAGRRKYMRTMRQKAGAEVLLSNKARELWHRNYVLRILTLWQAFNNTGGCNGDSISTQAGIIC